MIDLTESKEVRKKKHSSKKSSNLNKPQAQEPSRGRVDNDNYDNYDYTDEYYEELDETNKTGKI